MRAPFAALLCLAGCSPIAPGPPGVVSGRILSRDGPLPNVFVFVKEGLDGRTFDVPKEPVVLDQRGFEFVPRVFGMRAGQPLRITSGDYTMHNVNCQPFNNPGFNVSLMQDESITKTFPKPEVMILFGCNVHGAMRAYAGVLDHPYFAVTGPDGAFELPPLPPGAYTIEAWDEYRGSTRGRVEIAAGSGATLDVKF